jgi:hypothetical protein
MALRHASQLAGDGARDDAGRELRGGRAPVFAHDPVNPDEGQEGGGLQPRGAAGWESGKDIYTDSNASTSYYTGNNPLIINNTPVYASPP